MCSPDAPVQSLLFRAPVRARGRFWPGARGHLGALRAPGGACRRCGGHRVAFPAEVAGLWEVGGRRSRANTRNRHQHARPSRQWHHRPWHRLRSPPPPPPHARPGTPGVANGLNEHRHHQHHHRRTGTTHKPGTSPPPTTNTPPAAPHHRRHHHGTHHTSTTGGDVGHTTRQLQHPRHHRHIRPTNVTADNTTYAHTSPTPCSPTITSSSETPTPPATTTTTTADPPANHHQP